MDIQARLIAVLQEAAGMLSETDLPPELSARLRTLAEEVRQPCVVAVVGRVKAGKSSFINALLGADLAKVGATETTATINYFRYGESDPERPVTCHWRNGESTSETRAFLDSLQGNDEETLRRAEGIAYLEYHILSPFLERVTLVDTPGTRAVVQEHGRRTDEFLHTGEREARLRQRHDQETRRLGSTADAVIYVLGSVAMESDRTMLEQCRSLNAIGVLAKIDQSPELLTRRDELAADMARQLPNNLNTIVPVSAEMRRALDRLLRDDADGLKHLITLIHSIPADLLEHVLAFIDLYRDPELPCAVTVDERMTLLGDMPWTVFTAIARAVADPSLDLDAAAARLGALSGFDRLHDVLERRFLQRGHCLRAHRILEDARKLLDDVKYRYEPAAESRKRERQARVERMLAFIDSAPGDPETAEELRRLVRVFAGRAENLTATREGIERSFHTIHRELESYEADTEALLPLYQHPEQFSAEEQEELRPLFGLYGLDRETRLGGRDPSLEQLAARQFYWIGRQNDPREARRLVARRAEACYGALLEEVVRAAPAGVPDRGAKRSRAV